MNDVTQFADIFAGIGWSGRVPVGCTVDFLGTKTSKDFLIWGASPAYVDGAEFSVPPPSLGDGENGEFWFEAVDWFVAAREARERFVMVSLGALYGYQLVGAQRALQRINPLPCKLIAVEPTTEHVEWIRRHFRDNGLDPRDHWIVEALISDTNDPAFFPMGAVGLGGNMICTNEDSARREYYERAVRAGKQTQTLESLLKRNTTGLQMDIIAGMGLMGEIKLVSTITLNDLLGPLGRVDLLEADIQEAEKIVFPAALDALKRKVRRIHLGTHGLATHQMLHRMFADDGWEIVFSYEPERMYRTDLGNFSTNDGILTVANPRL